MHGLRFTVTDRERFDAAEFGLELLAVLHAQYPQEFQLEKARGILLNDATMKALAAGTDPHDIEASLGADAERLSRSSRRALLYGYLPPGPNAPKVPAKP